MASSSPSPSAATNATMSGCQVCASSGDCSHAYLDGPGQFCGNWLDSQSQRQRCCCPRDATCKLSNYTCSCTRVKSSAKPHNVTNVNGMGIGFAVIAVVVAGIIFRTCYVFFRKKKARTHPDAIPSKNSQPVAYPPVAVPIPAPGYAGAMAQPVGYPPGMVPAQQAMFTPTTGQYAYATAPMPTANGYGYAAAVQQQPQYHHHHHYTTASSGGGLGGVANFMAGMVVADMLTDGFGGGARHIMNGFGGGDDGGGVEVFGGDF